ncbi:MAG: co-chaperone GroES [Caldisericia bacterium]|jgi:chaperonin GroES|nr:co-chaperone GroES [Caldisericia bacterium]
MKLRPIGDKIIVEPEKEEEKTKSGIVLPDTAKEKPQKGKVIAVGPGKILDNGQRSPMEVKEGDIVIYSKYAGTEVKIDDKEYLILSDRDVLAILE